MNEESAKEKIMMILIDEIQPLQRDETFYKEKLDEVTNKINDQIERIYNIVDGDGNV